MFGGLEDGLFEIREYHDDDGNVTSHDVVDVTKQMEMLQKICGEQNINSTTGDEVRSSFHIQFRFLASMIMIILSLHFVSYVNF